MASVVVIHAAEDTLPARALAEKLRQAKLEVLLEKPPGDELRNAVKAAPVTIALWSPRSVAQPPLAEEVAFARSKSKLIHANMQSAATPQQFRGDQTVNLTGWRGEDDFPAWRELAQLVTSKAGVAPLPPPAPRPPSGFFTPGAPPTQPAAAPQPTRPQQLARAPQAPSQQRPAAQAQRPAQQERPAPPRSTSAAPETGEKKGGNGLVIGLVAVIAVALIGGGGYWFMTQQQGAQASATAWEQVEQNNAAAIRAFLDGNPGDLRDDAEAALVALEDRTFEAASDADTIDALQSFLADFPDSQHAISARGRIAELQTLPQTPVASEVPVEGLPAEGAPLDPDLVPPNATAPDAGGPAPITPPPSEAPAPLVEPGAPTN